MYTFKNVFFKKPRHVWANAQTPAQSVLLTALPEGELLNFNTILGNVINNKDNDCLKTKKDIEGCLDDLIKQGHIVEIHGERLFRLFKDYLK